MKLNILFTCVGRRVGLVKAFKEAASKLGIDCTTVGTDINPLSPAIYACDKAIITRPIVDEDYISEILANVRKHKIDLVVPTIDTELIPLSRHRSDFEAIGVRVLVSSLAVNEICKDKRKTFQFLKKKRFGTPWTWELSELNSHKLKFPVFLKPWDGSASRGSAIAHSREELDYLSKRIPNCIIQEYMAGQEYTCDVYVDFKMRVRTVVPRKRIEVRSGEVSKGQTAAMPELMDLCKRLVEILGAGPGVITIQCFVTKDNKIKFIEVNPRFGGGSPLSIKAGADFPKWIMTELLGHKPKIRFGGWKNGLYMLRYDEEIWLRQSDIKEAR